MAFIVQSYHIVREIYRCYACTRFARLFQAMQKEANLKVDIPPFNSIYANAYTFGALVDIRCRPSQKIALAPIAVAKCSSWVGYITTFMRVDGDRVGMGQLHELILSAFSETHMRHIMGVSYESAYRL